jgi:hypothetical protein
MDFGLRAEVKWTEAGTTQFSNGAGRKGFMPWKTVLPASSAATA